MPPCQLVSFVERQVRSLRQNAVMERRAVPRDLLVVPVTVLPINAKFQPIGEPFTAVTRDISPKGAGLVCIDPIIDEQLVLRIHLANEVVNVVFKLRWCEAMGPFYYAGVQFVTKLEAFPSWDDHSNEVIEQGDGPSLQN